MDNFGNEFCICRPGQQLLSDICFNTLIDTSTLIWLTSRLPNSGLQLCLQAVHDFFNMKTGPIFCRTSRAAPFTTVQDAGTTTTKMPFTTVRNAGMTTSSLNTTRTRTVQTWSGITPSTSASSQRLFSPNLYFISFHLRKICKEFSRCHPLFICFPETTSFRVSNLALQVEV